MVSPILEMAHICHRSIGFLPFGQERDKDKLKEQARLAKEMYVKEKEVIERAHQLEIESKGRSPTKIFGGCRQD